MGIKLNRRISSHTFISGKKGETCVYPNTIDRTVKKEKGNLHEASRSIPSCYVDEIINVSKQQT